MENTIYSLFDQLGLDSTDDGVEKFVDSNSPLSGKVELHEAKFWNECQSSFLKQAVEDDADWVDVVNQLDVMLRSKHHQG